MVCRPGHEGNPLERMRHSCAHVMADAVQKLFPKAKITIGPVIEDGFFYDFEYPPGFSPEDLVRIEKKMAEIVAANHPFQRKEVVKEEARKFFGGLGENYKLEILDGIADEKVSLYQHGSFIDLCKGPHIGRTGQIKAFKLLKVAGAYWRGDERNPMLQRIYGTCFESDADLKMYLNRLEEAVKRDHRKLGQELGLFSIEPEIGGGLVLWHPKGATIRHLIEDFLHQELTVNGYEFVYSPHIGRSKLWETSGHLDFFKENMYAPMDVEGQSYFLKPMNCPFHIAIYRSKLRSYRDLPIRFAEFGTVYRYERSGVLQGLTRVRGLTQDDAHIFCRPDQVEIEIQNCLELLLKILKTFGLTQFRSTLSTKPEKAVGDDLQWEFATLALKKALEDAKLPYEVDAGGGAFYGPKIDIQIQDALGRYWQCSTIQFDFNLPQRFDLKFMDQESQGKRPYMIHRALLGSLERFLGILIEHYCGSFPTWLAPVQSIILNISETQESYCQNLLNRLKKDGIRAEWDARPEKLGLKIRTALMQKIPYMLVVGEKEIEADQVSVRSKKEKDLGPMSVEAFIQKISREVADRTA